MHAQSEHKGAFAWYFKIHLLTRILIGLIAGLVVGIILAYMPETASSFVSNTKFFGDVFIRLLQMLVIPVVFFSLITGAGSISPAQLGRVGTKTIFFYLVLSILAVVIGLVVANILRPGVGMDMAGTAVTEGKQVAALTMSQIFLNIVPTNPIGAMAQGQLLPIIFFALCFGIGLSVIRDSKDERLVKVGDAVFTLCSGCAETMYVVVRGVMQYAPIGVFFLITAVFATQGSKVIGPLLYVITVVYIGFIIHIIVGYGGILKLNGLSFKTFLRGVQEAMVTAFVTRSSNATLPVSLRVSGENLGVPDKVSSFSLPLGATINMDGTSIYMAVCAMFIAFATGNPLSFNQQVTVVITATLGALGTAGVPGAGAIMLLMVLESVGLKVEAGSAVAATYAMILGVDAILDMGRTCLNVTGDITATVVVSKREKLLDLNLWK